MNLLQLSDKIGIPPKKLKDRLENEFQIIILSDHMPLRQSVVEKLLPASPLPLPIQEITDILEQLKTITPSEPSYTKQLLDYCIDNRFLFFIDTCSLIHESFYDFYNLFKQHARKKNVKLYVPHVMMEELKQIQKKRKKPQDVLSRCDSILEFITSERESGLIDIVGSNEDRRQNERGEKVIHADRVILEKLMCFRNNARSSLFITQDHDVTIDALNQNNLLSSKSNALIIVKKIIKGGVLVDNSEDAKNPPLPKFNFSNQKM